MRDVKVPCLAILILSTGSGCSPEWKERRALTRLQDAHPDLVMERIEKLSPQQIKQQFGAAHPSGILIWVKGSRIDVLSRFREALRRDPYLRVAYPVLGHVPEGWTSRSEPELRMGFALFAQP